MSTRKKIAKGCGVVMALGAIATAAVVYFWADFPIAAMRLGAAEERARKAGVPLTQAELRQHFPFDPEQNSAPVYHRIFEEHRGEFGGVREAMEDALAPGGRGPQEALRAAARVSGPMAELYRASKLRYYVHELDLDQLGFEVGLIQMPINATFRQTGFLFSMRGEAHARMGRAEEAARDLGTARRIAGQIGQDPYLISALVAHAIDAVVMRGVQRSAEALARNPAGLEVLEREVRSWPEPLLDFRMSLLGEAYSQIATTRTTANPTLLVMDLAGMDTEGPLGRVVPRADESQAVGRDEARGWVARGSMTRMLDGWAAFFEAVPKTGATPADFELGFQQMQQVMEDRRLSFLLARMLTEPLPQSVAAIKRPIFERQSTLAYLDVLQSRNQHGRWPESLAEAGVEALDPYDGQPLRYRVEGDGFRIWSVGHDGRDDGGITRREAAESASFDLVAIYPQPATSP